MSHTGVLCTLVLCTILCNIIFDFFDQLAGGLNAGSVISASDTWKKQL